MFHSSPDTGSHDKYQETLNPVKGPCLKDLSGTLLETVSRADVVPRRELASAGHLERCTHLGDQHSRLTVPPGT